MEQLPIELLHQIFSYLTYGDLKLRIPSVSRKWKSILSQKSKTGLIDKILFRDAVVGKPTSSQDSSKGFVTINPVLPLIRYYNSHTLNVHHAGWERTMTLYVRYPGNGKTSQPATMPRSEIESFKTSVVTCDTLTENATSPPCSSVNLYIRNPYWMRARGQVDLKKIPIQNPDGTPVSVMQVMKEAYVSLEEMKLREAVEALPVFGRLRATIDEGFVPFGGVELIDLVPRDENRTDLDVKLLKYL